MKMPRIINALNHIDEDLLEEAAKEPAVDAKVRRNWKPVLAAASVMLIAGGAMLWGWASQNNDFAAAGGAETENGVPEGAPAIHYEGPILPLSALEETPLSINRRVVFDFAQEKSSWSDGRFLVQEHYQLTNNTAEEQTVNLVYPFCANFRQSRWPVIRLENEEIHASLVSGGYAGGFAGVPGHEQMNVNLSGPDGWEDYQTLLQDGSYWQAAQSKAPVLEQLVTVYELSNFQGAEGHDAATIAMHFTMDPQKTSILTYRFNGSSSGLVPGKETRSAFIQNGGAETNGKTCYLIAVGEDITEYQVKGYQDGSCDLEKELPGLTADVVRWESTLGEIFEKIAREEYEEIKNKGTAEEGALAQEVSFETYFEAALKFFAQNGPQGTESKERYERGELRDILQETASMPRVLYWTFQVTVPAGESVLLTVEMQKPASYFYEWEDPRNARVMSFELASNLGSNLSFASQSVEICGTENLEIVEQDFDFDLQNEIRQTQLDPERSHWKLAVRLKEK